MRAMVLETQGRPLRPSVLPEPRPGRGELLLEVAACGVCRTDLHVVDGELAGGRLPIVPGHQIVATVLTAGDEGARFAPGDRVGVPWVGSTCGECRPCRSGRENLCDRASFTGHDRDGGFAELTVADERFCFSLPPGYPDLQAAPLLCSGLIGHRALRLAGDGVRLGLFGFGSAAHIVTQVALHEGRRVFAFTRAGASGRGGSPGSSAPSGRGTRSGSSRRSSMRRSSSRRRVSSYPPRSPPSPRAAPSSAPAST